MFCFHWQDKIVFDTTVFQYLSGWNFDLTAAGIRDSRSVHLSVQLAQCTMAEECHGQTVIADGTL